MSQVGCADDRTICCDVDCDVMQGIWQEELQVDTALTAETSANIEVNGGLWRQSYARKFSEVGAIEAAVTDVILSGAPINEPTTT